VKLALRSGPFESRKARTELGYESRPLADALGDAVIWLLASDMERKLGG
jgi:hypothetical protein